MGATDGSQLSLIGGRVRAALRAVPAETAGSRAQVPAGDRSARRGLESRRAVEAPVRAADAVRRDGLADSDHVSADARSEEHTSELQSHSFISYAVFFLKKNNN